MHPPSLFSAPLFLVLVLLSGCASSIQSTPKSEASKKTLSLHLRSRIAADSNTARTKENLATWDPKRTAIIVCDMWNDHWCKSAAARVEEMIEPMNRTLDAARAQGVFIIHAPSSVTSFYNGTAARELARKAPHAPTPHPLASTERCGTCCQQPEGRSLCIAGC